MLPAFDVRDFLGTVRTVERFAIARELYFGR